MARAKQDDAVKTTYILTLENGEKQKVTVPSSWKVTFGALYPGKDANTGRTGLRFYEGEQQRAVFTRVESFRDASIAIEVEVVQSQEQAAKVQVEGEGEKTILVRGETRQWVNPDDPKVMNAGKSFFEKGGEQIKQLADNRAPRPAATVERAGRR